MLQRVPKEKIVTLVTQEIKKSQRTIMMTMLLKEEIINPLSNSYFNLLKSKLKQGVSIYRIGFGTQNEYKKLKNKISYRSHRYTFRRINKNYLYIRCICVDNLILFFRMYNYFFKTQNKLLIYVLKSYFNLLERVE